MAIDKLTPRYLNLDNDYRILDPKEMSYALNVRTSTDSNGNFGVIKNVNGNELVETPLPIGTNKTVGQCSSERTKEVFFFVYNSSNQHSIYRYNIASQSVDLLFRSNFLNFKKNSFVKADVVYTEDGDVLVYFTDGVNPPRKINATKALIQTGYPSTTQDLIDIELSVCKQPPMEPIGYEFETDLDKEYNFLNEKMFQFAYQYVYDDGEISAISTYSKIAISPNHINSGFLSQEQKKQCNKIKLTLANSASPEVKKIRLLVRNGNVGSFGFVKEYTNNSSIAYQNVDFYNESLYSYVSDDEYNKMYDNVPQTAVSQTVSNNRLFYGNYTEGYPNIETDADLSVLYDSAPKVYNIDVYYEKSAAETDDYAISDNTLQNGRIFVDLTSIPEPLPEDSTCVINFIVAQDYAQAGAELLPLNIYKYDEKQPNGNVETRTGFLRALTLKLSPTVVYDSFTALAGETRATINTKIYASIVKSYQNSINPNINEPGDSTFFYTGPVGFEGLERLIWFSGSAQTKITYIGFSSGIGTYKFSINSINVRPSRITDINLTIFNSFNYNIGTFDEPNKKRQAYNNLADDEKEYVANPSYGEIVEVLQNSNLATTYMYDFNVETNISYLTAFNEDGVSTFKSDSEHGFGIVYYDSKNRSGGVNELGTAYVEPFGSSVRTDNGRSRIQIELKHNPPSWAKKYQIVYSGNLRLQEYHQYTVLEAFIANRVVDDNDTVDALVSNSYAQKVYLAMRGLEGKPDSYKSTFDVVNLEYKFSKGDKVRVIRYLDETNGYVYPKDIVFEVVGYEFFDNSNSPLDVIDVIYDAGDLPSGADYEKNKTYRRTGWFLVVNTFPEYDGFKYENIIAGNDNFFKNCLIEIQKPKKAIDNPVYYEIGESFDIINNQHSVSSIVISSGDAYFKRRRLRVNTIDSTDGQALCLKYDIESTDYDIEFVEDAYLSDFFDSNFTSLGRPNAYLPEAKTMRRISSVTYSEPYVLDSDRLNLSSFNPSKANWKDYPVKHGAINYLVDKDTAIMLLHENKVGVNPVNRNIIEFTNGEPNITTTTNVLGTETYFAPDFGINGNPESVATFNGYTSFADVRMGRILMASNEGLEVISDKGMSSFFFSKFRELHQKAGRVRIHAGYDAFNNELVYTVEPIYSQNANVGDTIFELPSVDGESGVFSGVITYSNSGIPNWEDENRVWELVCDFWDAIGNGIIYLDKFGEASAIFVDPSLQGQTGVIQVMVTDTNRTFYAVADLDLATGEFTLPEQDCAGDPITFDSEPEKVYEEFTVSYNLKLGYWSTFYSFYPEIYTCVHDEFFSIKDGALYRHNKNSVMNMFYGQQFNSSITIVSNNTPSAVKAYDAMSIEGNSPWSVSMTTEDQETSFGDSYFTNKEGEWFSYVTRDSSINSTSNYISLGVISSINGNELFFDSKISYLPYTIGDDMFIKDINGDLIDSLINSGYPSSSKSMIVLSSSPFSVGDEVVVKTDSTHDGDQMRGNYLVTTMTNTDIEPVELYAVNFNIKLSNLHNSK